MRSLREFRRFPRPPPLVSARGSSDQVPTGKRPRRKTSRALVHAGDKQVVVPELLLRDNAGRSKQNNRENLRQRSRLDKRTTHDGVYRLPTRTGGRMKWLHSSFLVLSLNSGVIATKHRPTQHSHNVSLDTKRDA